MTERNSPDQEGRGRSARKRAAKAIEKLAQALTALPEAERRVLPLRPDLEREIEQVRSTRGHSARKRQLKHLAGLLRRDDDQRIALEAALEAQAVTRQQHNRTMHQWEQWRDGLCDPKTFETTLKTVLARHPGLDGAKLRQLAGAVHDQGDKQAFREIFRLLRNSTEKDRT